MLSVGFHITVSQSVKNIPKIIIEFANDTNNISAQIFLFSVLFMLEKNTARDIHVAISNPTKWKSKFLGLNISNILAIEVGKYIHVSNEKDT